MESQRPSKSVWKWFVAIMVVSIIACIVASLPNDVAQRRSAQGANGGAQEAVAAGSDRGDHHTWSEHAQVQSGAIDGLGELERVGIGRSFFVFDRATGEAVHGALLLPFSSERFARDADVLARSAPDGWIHGVNCKEVRTFTVTHEDFVPCCVSVNSVDGVLNVPLDAGASLKIVCTDLKGRPAQDLLWIVSRTAVDDSLLDVLMGNQGAREIIGTGSPVSFRPARSNVSGVAEVRGLMPGHYGISLVSRDHAVVRGRHYRSGVFVPREGQADMCVAGMYGVRLVMSGDEIVTFKADLPAGLMGQGSIAGIDVESRLLAARRKFPGEFVCLGADGGMEDSNVHVRAFLRRLGWMDVVAPLGRLQNGEIPTHVCAVSPGEGTIAVGRARLELLDPQGNPVDVPGMALESDSCSRPLKWGSPIELPPGQYRVTGLPLIARLLGQVTFHVEAGQSVERTMRLDSAVHRVRLFAKDELGNPVEAVGVDVFAGPALVMRTYSRKISDVEFWLEGKVHEFRLRALGLEGAGTFTPGDKPGQVDVIMKFVER